MVSLDKDTRAVVSLDKDTRAVVSLDQDICPLVCVGQAIIYVPSCLPILQSLIQLTLTPNPNPNPSPVNYSDLRASVTEVVLVST